VRREHHGNKENIHSSKEEKRLMNDYYTRHRHLSTFDGLVITVVAVGIAVGVLYIVSNYT
jgi:hypothetical protein